MLVSNFPACQTDAFVERNREEREQPYFQQKLNSSIIHIEVLEHHQSGIKDKVRRMVKMRIIIGILSLIALHIVPCKAFIVPNIVSSLREYHQDTVLWMGKGDGKKKRKKKSSSTPSLSSIPQETAPLRVTSDSNVSVRRQIKWARMKKEINNSGTAFRQKNVKRTSYRKSLDEEEIEEARLERQRKGQEPDWDVILNATASSPLVIVDAYNVIHKWPRLKKWMGKGMVSKARELLIHDMEELRALKGWRLEVVFDGFGRNTNGPLGDGPGSQKIRERISKPDQQASKTVTDNNVRIVYSGAGTSADGYIEKRCFEAKEVTEGKLTGSLIVVSDDNMIRTAACNAGALCMSSGRMVDELKALRKATMYRVEAAVAKANGHDVRPAQLQGKATPNAFLKGRGNVIIEDKRSKPKKNRKKDESEHTKTLDDLKKGTTSVPSWAIVPPKDKI